MLTASLLAGCATPPPPCNCGDWPATVALTPATVPRSIPRPPKPKPPPDEPAPTEEPAALPDVGWIVGKDSGFLLDNLGQPSARTDGWFLAAWTYRIENGTYCLSFRRDRTTYRMIVQGVEIGACPAP